ADLPSITIITPSTGPSPLLDETLASVANQDYPALQSLVIDRSPAGQDGEEGDEHQPSVAPLGLAEAINKGLREAKGELVGWAHPGDLLTVGALRAIGQTFAEDPELDLVYGNAIHVEDDDLHLAWIDPWANGFWSGELPAADNLLPPCRGGFAVPQATVFFRRRLLEEHGLLDESAPEVFFEYEFLTRLARSCRARKLHRTQALYRLRSVDVPAWWAEWYRRARRRWPRLLSRRFPEVLAEYVADYLKRRLPRGASPPVRWGVALLVGLSVALRLGNPERWRPPPAIRKVERTVVAEYLPTVLALDPLEAVVQDVLDRRKTRYHSLVCGPRAPEAGSASGSEAWERQILGSLARCSVGQFFAQHSCQPAAPDVPRQAAGYDVLHTPETLAELRPDLVSRAVRRAPLHSRVATHLRRHGLPVPGPRCPVETTRQFRYVRAHCSLAIQEILDE